jgi:S1-C subfamily serine protease
MTDIAPPSPPPKLLGSLATKLKLAAACAFILVLGAITAPRVVPSALHTPAERPAPLLEEQVQTRVVSQPFRGVADLADRVGADSVAFAPSPRSAADIRVDHAHPSVDVGPGGFGVFVSATDVLTDARALDGRTTLSVTGADGTDFDVRLAAYEPDTGLALLRAETPASPPVIRAPASLAAGALAVAAARVAGRETIVPLFITRVDGGEYTASGAVGGLQPGMPLYTLDGTLFAIAAGTGGRAYAVWDAADRLVARAGATASQSSIGIGYQAIGGGLTRIFGDEGVLINRVVSGGPADAAGLVPGDVLVAIGDTAVTFDGTEGALEQLTAGTAVPLRIRRGRQTQTIEVTPATAFAVAATAHRSPPDAASAPAAGAILPPETLARAGLHAAARILRINQRAMPTRAEAARELARDPRAILLVHDGDRTFFTAIEPS